METQRNEEMHLEVIGSSLMFALRANYTLTMWTNDAVNKRQTIPIVMPNFRKRNSCFPFCMPSDYGENIRRIYSLL